MLSKRVSRDHGVRKWISRLRWLRRGVLLGGIAAGAVGGTRMFRGKPMLSGGAAPASGGSRPAASLTPAGSGNAGSTAKPFAGTTSVTWVDPIDGECPDGYPIKANANSMIYHVPGGRFYARTHAERCYAEAAEAQADGFRPAKGA